MAQQVTYTTPAQQSMVFNYPVVTVTEVPRLSARGDFVASVEKIFTIRGLIIVASGELTEEKLRYWRQGLNTSGGELVIDWGKGRQTIVNNKTDLVDGPHPQAFSVDRCYGTKTFQITWQVRTLEFPREAGYSGEIAKWVDLVYTTSTSLNENFSAIRTISGVLTLNRTNQSIRGKNADAFRMSIIKRFGIPEKGRWQRIQQSFNVVNNYQSLAFTIVDKELYSWLPAGATRGDVEIHSTTEKHGQGRLSLSGWFESTHRYSRGNMFAICSSVLNLLYTKVLVELVKRHKDEFYIRREFESFRMRLSSNRVDFSTEFFILGSLPNEIPETAESVVKQCLEWLAYLSKKGKPAPDEGPYGTSGHAGEFGRSVGQAPAITIDFDAKKEAHGTHSGGGGGSSSSIGSDTGATSGRTKTQNYIDFKQSFSYRIVTGRRLEPGYGENAASYIAAIHKPIVYLTVLGEAITGGNTPKIPAPPYKLVTKDDYGSQSDGITADNTLRAVLIDYELSPQSPTTEGEYSIAWRYVLQLIIPAGYLDSRWLYQATLPWPSNPMLENQEEEFRLKDVDSKPW